MSRQLVRLAVYLALVLAALWMAGCSHAINPNSAAALKARNQAIQNCILSGGHARLGPDNTILCER